MFSTKDPIRNLSITMEQETELLHAYFIKEKELFEAVISRNWQMLDGSLREMEKIGEGIARLEEKREMLVQRLEKDYRIAEGERFYTLLQHLPEEVRESLAASFRNMKVAVYRLQALDGQIQGYLRSATTTLKEIVDELFPHQKGTMYCKRGKTSAPEANPMFISRHL